MNYLLYMDFIGWLGSAMVVAAYFLISFRKLDSSSQLYQLLNFFGSTLLIAFTIYKEAYPPATVNSIWALIALFSLFQLGLKKVKKVKS